MNLGSQFSVSWICHEKVKRLVHPKNGVPCWRNNQCSDFILAERGFSTSKLLDDRYHKSEGLSRTSDRLRQ